MSSRTAGFVERRRNPADRRSYGLYLTDTGRDMLAKVQAAGLAHQAELGRSLSAGEQDQLTALLRRVARGAGHLGAQPAGHTAAALAPRLRPTGLRE